MADKTTNISAVSKNRRRSRAQRIVDDSQKLAAVFQRKISAMPPREQKICELFLARHGKLEEQRLAEMSKQPSRRRRSATTSRPVDIGITAPYNISEPKVLALLEMQQPGMIRAPSATSAFWKHVRNAQIPSEILKDENGLELKDAEGRILRGLAADETLANLFDLKVGELIPQRRVQRLITDMLIKYRQ